MKAACEPVRARLLGLAGRIDGSPLAAVAPEDVAVADGAIRSRRDPEGARGANAVSHATGRRIRELPITPDRLL